MAETTLQELVEKNKFLEEELQTLRDLFQNLNSEAGMENPDQRRSFMLKAQNYQLERQCMLLSQAQSNRASVLTEIESQLQQIITMFQSLIAEKKPGPDVSVKRSQLMAYLGSLRKMKNSLFKQSQLESSDNLRLPSLMSGSKFLKSHAPLDCMDLFKMRPENLNTKYLSNLEQELSQLRKQLISLNLLMQSHGFNTDIDGADISKYLCSPWVKKFGEESVKCVTALEHCSDELVALSLLQPSAPWSKVRIADDFGALKFDKIIKSLPSSLQKNSVIRSKITEMIRAHDHVTQCQNDNINLLCKQLAYHKAVQRIQLQYTLQFSHSVWTDYQAWKDSAVDGICNPIAGLMQSWRKLKENQHDANLKQFLSSFKTYESHLEKLSSPGGHTDMLNELNEHLDQSLKRVAAEYDEAINKLSHP